jgi:hypothetical protein
VAKISVSQLSGTTYDRVAQLNNAVSSSAVDLTTTPVAPPAAATPHAAFFFPETHRTRDPRWLSNKFIDGLPYSLSGNRWPLTNVKKIELDRFWFFIEF